MSSDIGSVVITPSEQRTGIQIERSIESSIAEENEEEDPLAKRNSIQAENYEPVSLLWYLCRIIYYYLNVNAYTWMRRIWLALITRFK